MNLLYKYSFYTLLAIASTVFFTQTMAQPQSDWTPSEYGDVRLVSGYSQIQGITAVPMAMEFKLPKGWKIYHKDSRDAGYPPSIEFKVLDNGTTTPFLYPLPMDFVWQDVRTKGYENTVLFPFILKDVNPNKAVNILATIDFLACDVQCIPVRSDVRLHMPAKTAFKTLHYGSIVSEIRKAQSLKANSAVNLLAYIKDSTQDINQKSIRRITDTSESLGTASTEDTASTTNTASTEDTTSRVSTANTTNTTRAENTTGIKNTDTQQDTADKVGATNPTTQTHTNPTGTNAWHIFIIILTAMLGGLILNIMPCVLPVLSLKVLALVQLQPQNTTLHIKHKNGQNINSSNMKHNRQHLLYMSFGIIFTFFALACVLIVIKVLGGTVGWGIQFQNASFLAIMATVMFILSVVLLDKIIITLPNFITNRMGGASVGAFMNGVLATVLATPCSAPFVGVSVGFALTTGAVETLVIFVAMGVGMALPYIIIAIFPYLAGFIPKPGKWMMTVKRIMAGFMALMGGYLLWILSHIIPITDVIFIIFGMGILLTVFTTEQGQRFYNLKYPIGFVVLVGIGVLAYKKSAIRTQSPLQSNIYSKNKALPFNSDKKGIALEKGQAVGTVTSNPQSIWYVFSPANIPVYVQQGKTVVVNITAKWCITCGVNKIAVFDDSRIQNILKSENVIAMQGDWTIPDASISKFLARYNRYGIPFTAVFNYDYPTGRVLPEILSVSDILDLM